jgi:hypothetical protein
LAHPQLSGSPVSPGYYDTLLPVRELDPAQADQMAVLDAPHHALASVRVPGGSLVVRLASDSPMLARIFVANWAHAEAGSAPDATLVALKRPARGYGLDGSWDAARWWSPSRRTMIIFSCRSYRLVKVCVRGICSAVGRDDVLFLHGCALAVSRGGARRGVVITGGSGVGKTTLVANLLRRAAGSVKIINDDWGALSLTQGLSVNTGERNLHMKKASVLALRPDFFAAAPPGTYFYDRSEPDRTVRLLVHPRSVYGANWDTGGAVIDHVAAIVRAPRDWLPPAGRAQAVHLLRSGGQHHEQFFNGSLILRTARDGQREESRYQRLLDRACMSWLNNCGTPDALAENFLSALDLA